MLLTKRGPGEAYRRYRVWRGWDFDEGKVYGMSSRRSWWTGCGWSLLRRNGKVYRSDAEVRTALDRMEADGLAANAEAFHKQ